MNQPVEDNFRQQVQQIVAHIPFGRVMTYGDIAAMCGSPRAARIVGGIAHYGDTKLPWHRVVKKNGSLAEGYPGGIPAHEKHLRAEGVMFLPNGRVNMLEAQWRPALEGGG